MKASAGGGGRGIFLVTNEDELEDAFEKASAMAEASFGNPRLFVEKYLPKVHHIEIQVIADRWGNVFAFDERDCTVQRNNQKLLEVTPSPWRGMTPKLRAELKDYARRLVLAVGYHSVATVEFLVTEAGEPYMIEVNTRLQVEHGITESRYGVRGKYAGLLPCPSGPRESGGSPGRLHPQFRPHHPLRLSGRTGRAPRLEPLRRL